LLVLTKNEYLAVASDDDVNFVWNISKEI
jgi:hypothetical protein